MACWLLADWMMYVTQLDYSKAGLDNQLRNRLLYEDFYCYIVEFVF